MSHLDTQSWFVQVAGKPYGPYSADQMSRFIDQGRITGMSQVATTPVGPWSPAHETALSALLYPTSDTATQTQTTGLANILAYIEQNTPGRLDAALGALGIYVAVTPQIYLLRTTATVSRARTVLAMAMGPYDRFLLVDATRNRAAWQNMGPEAEAGFRAVWNASLTTAANDAHSAM